MRKYLDAYKPSIWELWLIMLVILCLGGTVATLIGGKVISILFRPDPESLKTWLIGLYPLSFTFVFPYVYFRAKEFYLRGNPTLHAAASFGRLPVVLVFLLFLVLVPFFNIAIEPFSMWIPMPDLFKEIFASVVQGNWVTVLSVVVAAPLLEEWLLRGVALKGLLQRGYSPAAAICWTALMFGVIHLNPWQAIPAFLMGILFGWVYWRTRSLWSSIFLHAVNNGMTLLLTLVFPDLAEDTSTLDLVGMERFPLVLAAAITASALIIWLLHKQFPPSASLLKREEKPQITL
ncbi:MAG: CPBP family intramembrane metalloprotease [Prevotellaceae bacterium]|nr:CPBP family intramembrane metalloprotease [Prevotellaceae bacterium]